MANSVCGSVILAWSDGVAKPTSALAISGLLLMLSNHVISGSYIACNLL